MLLIIGIPGEGPVRLLTKTCENMKLPYKIFDQRNQENWSVDINYLNFDNSIISDNINKFRIGDFTGIYLRAMDYTQIPEYDDCENKKAVDVIYKKLFKLLDNLESPRVVNPPTPMMFNSSRPYQSLIVRKYGLDIPDTCITNNKEEAAAFISKYKSVIYKSVNGAGSVVKQFDKDCLRQLRKILYCPVQFQECITGINVRVHVVGSTVIATKIYTDAVNYCYTYREEKPPEQLPLTLDAAIADKCVQLSRALHLPFSAIDLMLTNDGRTICFKVNPSPAYSYYESNTGRLICHTLAAYLAMV